MLYEHSQSLVWPIVVIGVGFVATTVLAVVGGEPSLWFTPPLVAVIGVLAYGLSRLNTTVTAAGVDVAFRWGWPRKQINRADIVAATKVRNRWWYGTGVHLIPGATMYNVWGLDAVHLKLADSKDFRIGTDDPDGLLAALTA